WEVLYHLEAILTVFETVVKTLEGDGHIRRRKQGWTGSYGNIWDVVLGYELLLNTLEEYKQLAADFPDPEHFRIGINLAWDKLDEYYRRLDETPIYYTAMALHPAYRWTGLMKRGLISLNQQQQRRRRATGKRPRFFNPFEKNSRLPSSIPPYAAAIVVDEYQAWQTDREASDGNVRDPIGYWITKQGRYPRLSRMALDFLTIQPMSAECERLFSAAGKMVSGLRTNLDAEIIAICQVLRSWYRAGLIKDLDPLLKSHLESKLDGGYGTLSDDELALAESKWLLEGEDSASEVNDSTQQQQAEESVSTSESEKPACKYCLRSHIPCVYKVTTRKAAPRTDYMAMLDKRPKRMEERIIKAIPKSDQEVASSVTRPVVKPAIPGTVPSSKPTKKRGAEEAFGPDLEAWAKAPSSQRLRAMMAQQLASPGRGGE
ncbi:hypothetical protein Forpi1262_v018717, partial [Fusarium oxysporum f. sp. raphani]